MNTTVKNFFIKAIGKKELLKYKNGNSLSRKEAIIAKCYDCCGCFQDGKFDCLIDDCPLYPWMAYKGLKEKGERNE